MKRHEQFSGGRQQANMFMIPIAFAQIAISPTSLKKQQLELKNGYFFYNYGHIDSVSSNENPSPQINVEIRC